MFSRSDYPPRHVSELRSVLWYASLAMLITGTAAGVATWLAVFATGSTLMAAVCLTAFVLFGLLGGLGSLYDTWRYVRIIPYFQRRVGEIDTFLGGEALAANFHRLEDLCRRAHVRPLSDFGFNDDLRGEPLIWHPAAEGLATVQGLIDLAGSEPETLPPAVLVDLQKLAQALRRAHEQAIDFCLLVRHGNSTSGHEWSIRKGTAF